GGGDWLARLVDPRDAQFAGRRVLLDLRSRLGVGTRRLARDRAAVAETCAPRTAWLGRPRCRWRLGGLVFWSDSVSGVCGAAAGGGRGVSDRGRRLSASALTRAPARDGAVALRRRPLVQLLPLALAGARHRGGVRRARPRPRDEAPARAGSVRALAPELPAHRESDSPPPTE